MVTYLWNGSFSYSEAKRHYNEENEHTLQWPVVSIKPWKYNWKTFGSITFWELSDKPAAAFCSVKAWICGATVEIFPSEMMDESSLVISRLSFMFVWVIPPLFVLLFVFLFGILGGNFIFNFLLFSYMEKESLKPRFIYRQMDSKSKTTDMLVFCFTKVMVSNRCTHTQNNQVNNDTRS